jgi:hypothetical protein
MTVTHETNAYQTNLKHSDSVLSCI